MDRVVCEFENVDLEICNLVETNVAKECGILMGTITSVSSFK